ncbi:MAG TPA: SDR family NAD(P)-dependent oxidoreductase [Bacteroidota bacterium]
MEEFRRVVIVTGAGRGIGKSVAIAFAKQKASLSLIARTLAELEQVAGEIGEGELRPMIQQCDIGDPNQVDKVVSATLKRFGRIDVLVNNAGIQGPIGPVEDLDFDSWKRVIDVNLMGTLRLMQRVIPVMKGQRWGRILNVSGGGATSALPRFTAYAASKVAIVRLTETIAQEVKEYGICVNAVAPGNVNTRMTEEAIAAGDRAGPEHVKKLRSIKDQGGISSGLVANLILFLASDEASGITGRLLSAVWDNWKAIIEHQVELGSSDIYTLRRILPEDRGFKW